ncbi:MAG TPA: hypothetical protein VGI60_14985 [Chthoniobacterales bacterium]|jgi:hypothetical protein
MTDQLELANTTETQTDQIPRSPQSSDRTGCKKWNSEAKSLPLSNAHWLAYATAAMASGLGLTSAAEGEIHYSGIVNLKMRGVQTGTLPLTEGASLRFFIYDFGSGSGYAPATFQITGAESAAAREAYFQVADIKRGSRVSIGPFTSVGNQQRSNIRGLYGGSNFGSHGGGFIGFKFNIGNGTQYGWARLQVSQEVPPPFSFRYIIKDYAWGDPGDPIAAGQKKSRGENVSITPEAAGSLGLLALGAIGLDTWRGARGQAPMRN